MNDHIFVEMVNQLVAYEHTYNGCTLSFNKDAFGRHLTNVVRVVIHPCSHHHTIALCKGHFHCAILNGEIIDLTSMIYRTIIYHLIIP